MTPTISTASVARWQNIVDVLAETLDADAAFIVVPEGDGADVLVSSRLVPHPYAAGRRASTPARGRFWQTVLEARMPLEITDASAVPKWREGPDAADGMVSFCGMPLSWPDARPFGMLGVVDARGRTWVRSQTHLLTTFRDIVEDHLGSAAAAHERREAARTDLEIARDLDPIIERLPLGAVLVRGESLTLNAAAERITGYKRHRIPTVEDWFRLLFLNHEAEARAQHEADRAAGFAMVSIRNITRSDGRTRLVEIAGARFGSDEIWLLRDVTGEEASAVALRESDERFRAVTDTAPVIIYTGDLERGCRFINRVGLEFFGMTLEEAQGNATFERVHPDDWRGCGRAHVRAMKGGAPVEVEFRVRHADDRYRWVVGRITPRLSSTGDSAGVVGVLTDITERKVAEEALRKLGERTQLAVEAARIGIWSFELDTGVSLWDERMCALYGWSEGRTIGIEDMTAAFHPEDRERVFAQWAAALVSGLYESQFRIIRPTSDGDETVYLQSLARVMRHEDGRPARMVGATWDVTQANVIQEELRRAKVQADAANRAKSEFLANMSHEIRTPMNGVLGMAEITLGTELSVEQREYVRTIQSSAESLLTVINDILDFSKMEAGKLELTTQDFHVRSGLEEVLKPLMVRAGEKGLHLIGEVDGAVPPRLHGPWERIRQVVTNLVGNAIKFTEEGDVTVRVGLAVDTATRTMLRIAVEDTGIGLTAGELRRIFQPFEQVDGGDHPRSGTGLGLAISAKLVEMMGGRIWVDSDPGHGSTFHATMRVEPAGRPTLRNTPPRGTAIAKPLTILLAEDHFVNRRVAETMLRNRGHRVEVAKTGREAVELFRCGTFDVVLMDVEMPDMNGLEATAAIRELEQSLIRRTPIVALTAYAMAGDGERFIAAGMDGYVTKPMDSKRLLGVIEELVHGE